MTKFAIITMLWLSVLGLTACSIGDSKYELREISGLPFLLDQRTGNLACVHAGKLISLPKQTSEDRSVTEKPVKQFESQTFNYGNGDGIESTLKAKWRGGQFCYRIGFSPHNDNPSKAIERNPFVDIAEGHTPEPPEVYAARVAAMTTPKSFGTQPNQFLQYTAAREETSNIKIELRDKDGFILAEVPLTKLKHYASARKAITLKKKTEKSVFITIPEGYYAEGSVELAPNLFDEIHEWTIDWGGD